MQKKKNRLFLFLRLAPLSWQTHQASKLLLASKKVDLLPHLRKEIHFLSRFRSCLVDLVKLFSRKFGMTHVIVLAVFAASYKAESQSSSSRCAGMGSGVRPR